MAGCKAAARKAGCRNDGPVFIMLGMAKSTGRALDGNEHLAQSLADILSTPLGTRVHRRDYGSMLFDLIDQPLTAGLRVLVHAATALAISRWEPRLRLRKVQMMLGLEPGELLIRIEGDRTDLPAGNAHVALSIPIRRGGIATGTS